MRWQWSKPRELAATLCANDDISDLEIVKAAGVVVRVL
jgi:hypothetical protein